MSDKKIKNRPHFAGLDGLRFLSILFVVLHHLFTFKFNFGFNNLDFPILGLIGYYGIQFFFMGSGFLITYLLLVENENSGAINLKNFFLRRILRIWPAYYLLLFLALILALPSTGFRIPGITDDYLAAGYKKSNLFFFTFLPHLQSKFFPTAPYVHHTYTIGIEEQFYLVWGLLFYFFRKRILLFFWILILLSPVLNWVHSYINSNPPLKDSHTSLRVLSSTIAYFQFSRFSTFAIGSLFGYAYFSNKKWVLCFKNRWIQIIFYSLLMVSIGFDLSVPFLYNEYISCLMGSLMIIATFKKESLFNFSGKWIGYLGKISYGIYLFHIFAIVFACKIVRVFFSQESSIFVTLLLCLLTLGFSIAFGILSYKYFELFFLRFKTRFRSISSHQP